MRDFRLLVPFLFFGAWSVLIEGAVLWASQRSRGWEAWRFALLTNLASYVVVMLPAFWTLSCSSRTGGC